MKRHIFGEICQVLFRKKWGDFSYEQRKSLEKSRLRIPRRYCDRGGVFKKENIPLYLMDSFSFQVDVPKNKDVISIERDYNIYESDEDYERAKDDLLYGRLKIYEVPFEYHSRVLYIMAGRFAARRKAESDLLKKTIMDDAEESVERFWKYGNLSKRYPRPDLLLRKADMKIFG